MNLNLKTSDIHFLTTNPQKTKDFLAMGFGVMKNGNEPKEILSPYSAEVALHKSKDTGILNAVVEDTSLTIEDAPFLGTQIKDFWGILSKDESYHGKAATWEISVCLSTETHFIVATGVTEGIIKFPKVEDAYHFDQVFAVQTDMKGLENTHWILLPPEQRETLSPRNKAVQMLKKAIETNDYSQVTVIEKENVPQWTGAYQSEELINKIAQGQAPKIR